jgi:hypothetical protein
MILYSSALALFGNGSPIDGWPAWIRVGNSNKDIRKSLFICKGSYSITLRITPPVRSGPNECPVSTAFM